MCSIIGVVETGPAATTIYDGLHLLQHRGQDAAGIVTLHKHSFNAFHGLGLAHDVFSEKSLSRLHGECGIGHVRYGTAGGYGIAEAQPFVVKRGGVSFALAHNGNLVNCSQLKKILSPRERSKLKSTSDSELLLHVILHNIGNKPVDIESLRQAVTQTMAESQGAYSIVLLVSTIGLCAFRDPHGIRPLSIGKRKTQSRTEVMIASESAAFSIGNFTLDRDVAPGEFVHISKDGVVNSWKSVSHVEHTPCIFEYVYFARPDSLIDDISVHRTRMRLGQRLGKRLKAMKKLVVDCVVPIPESARTSAIEIAQVLDVPFREGFVKNRYIGRTFITRGQASRVSKVRRKLTTLPLELKGKKVLIIDDSIVRGTTIKEIVAMVRASGARKVYVASTAPAVVSENIYGIDIATKEELVAVDANGKRKSDKRIARELGADAVFYQTIDDLYAAAREGNPSITRFDGSCFDGIYITGAVDAKRGKERRRNG